MVTRPPSFAEHSAYDALYSWSKIIVTVTIVDNSMMYFGEIALAYDSSA